MKKQNMENKFDEKQSLAVIGNMIAQAQNRIKRGDGNYFMWWGYVIAIASIAHFVWLLHDPQQAAMHADWIWGVATPLGLVGTLVIYFIERRKKKGMPYVRTYTDSIGTAVWAGFCVCAFALSFMLNGKNGALIYPSISLVYTFALFVSARAYRFRWMYWNVAVCAACVIAYKFLPMIYFPLLMGALMTVGNIIPGHIINCKARRRV